MPPNQGFDFSTGPKKVWVDRFGFASNGGLVHLAVTSGSETKVFVFDVTLAKKIARGLKDVVDKFETATGQKLDDRLDNDPMLSPMSGEMKPPNDTIK